MASQIHSHAHAQDVPRGALIAIAGLLGLTLLMVISVRLTGVGGPVESTATVKVERHLRFADQPDGGIAVYEAGSDRLIDRVAPGTNGFLRGTLRGLGRERRREGIARETEFDLVGTSDGHLLLIDPSTKRRVDLGSFGPTNAAVFVRLLDLPAAAASAGTAERSPS